MLFLNDFAVNGYILRSKIKVYIQTGWGYKRKGILLYNLYVLQPMIGFCLFFHVFIKT